MKIETQYTGLEIAVIGMSGRFPGANDLREFWENLVDGIESISFFTEEELLEAGVDPEQLSKPNYVKAKGVFPNVEYFDSDFFNYTPKDAQTIDPQVRVLHEEVYHALEDAGYASEQYRGSIDVFLGAANNIAWETQTLKTTIDDGGYGVATLQLNDKDHAATRIAYSLNLHGPSTTSYSACSTSLYAVDLACRNILTGSCHIAVAGGSNLTLPSKNGYLYDEGMIKSPDGHCRAFDHLAKGTVEGNGVGVVVLKGLQQAIKDGDHIYSIIKGTAVNNDGNRKVGYTAPSIEGQTEVIRRALKMGGVQANSVSYIESHGTGTVLGDPIEFTALKKVYEVDNNIQQVGIGALKPNIGHLDVAAGIASFIKTSLSLAHKQIPATINFSKINENIDIDNSNFYIVDQTKPWERTKVPNKEQCYMPLRAGISSFGIGGTNVHMILEEAPIQKYETQQRGTHLLCLSAKTETALINMKKSYLEYLNQEGENINPAHLAWSVHTGLRSFNKRYSTIYHTISELKDILEEDLEHMEKSTSTIPNGKPTVYFLFPGQGSQYSGMAKGLYETQATFRKVVDECLLEVEANGIDNLREILFEHSAENNKLLQETDMAQISLFIIEYALAQLLISWGIQPKGMTGHSLGEYVAAALAGVFTLKDGIRIICQRGVIMKKMPEGAMLGVNASEEQVLALLGENVSIAAVNGENQCTVSGSNEAIKSFEEKCKRKKIITRKLHTSHAFHSELMQDAVEPFETVLRDVELQSPKIPYISNLTGTWIKNEEATDATYYTKHLKQTVHFKQGIEQMMLDERVVVIEVGPGHTLSTFARQIGREHLTGAVNLIHHPKEEVSDEDYLTQSIGKLWGFGVVPEWKSYYKDEKHTRIKLPLYPFEKKKYPISVDAFYGLLGNNNVAQYRKVEVAPNQEEEDDLVAQENWEKVLRVKANATDEQRVCLVLTDNIERIEALSERLPRWRMIIFESGDQYTFRDSLGGYIRSGNALDLYLLCYELREYALLPDEIILSYKDEESTYSNLSELMQILRNEYKEKLPEVVVLSPYSPLMNYPRLVAKVQSELATQEELSLRLIDAGTQNQEQLSVWAEIIQKEITAENNPYPVVMYLNGERLVPKLSILDKNELVNNNYFSERNILVVCNEENVDQVKVRFYQEEYTDKLKVLPYKLVDEGYKRGILKEIVSELSQQQKSYLEQYGIPDMSEAHKLMDEYTIRLVFEYINGLMTLNVGTRFSQEEMIEALRIEPTFEKYVDYFIHIFKEDGLIKPLEDGMQYIVTEAIKYLRNKEVIKCDLQKLTNLFDGQLELLEHCVSHFEKALSGEESALGVLYPPEQKDLLIKTYAGTYQEKEDELIRSIFAKLVERLIQEKGKIRILEVGGGYGTIPRYIATLLKDTEVEYYFTDVGKTYIEDFKKFAVQEDLKCFSYGLFDVSKSPKEQGLEEESFDLVFAYNVIHATYQLQTSLNNMQQILKPGGVMCVLERTCPRRFIDMIWGLAEGWWYFDHNERSLSPLSSTQKWQEQFEAVGLEEVIAYPNNETLSNQLDAGIIIGQRKLKEVGKENKKASNVQVLPSIISKKEEVLIAKIRSYISNMQSLDHIILWTDLVAEEEKFKTLCSKVNKQNELFTQIGHVLSNVANNYEKNLSIIWNITGENKWLPQLTDGFVSYHIKQAGNRTYNICLRETPNVLKIDYLALVGGMIESGLHQAVVGYQLIAPYTVKIIKKKSTISSNELTEIEEIIKKAWCKLFGHEEIDLDQDFFELGGDSFKIIQMTVDLENKGYKVLANEVYKYPTIRLLANYLREQSGQNEVEIKSGEELSEYLFKTTRVYVIFRVVVKDQDQKINLMFIDDSIENAYEIIKNQLRTKRIPSEYLPHYILPMSLYKKLPEQIALESLKEQAILTEYNEDTISTFIGQMREQQCEFNKQILSQRIISRYGLTTIQRMHFKGEVRLQLYLIAFDEMVDEGLLEQAFCNIVSSHGVLRSCLEKRLIGYSWREYASPMKLDLPKLDLSGLTPSSQEKVMDYLIKEQWQSDFKIVGSPMYHVVLIKFNECKYQLLFQFDHSIFDVTSGQILRMHILRRYKELQRGVKRAMDVSGNYKAYIDQIKRGPINTTPAELIKMLNMKTYGEKLKLINEKIKAKGVGKTQMVHHTVDLNAFQYNQGEGAGSFELALQIYILVLAELLQLDYIAFDLLFQNRKYENQNFSDTMGVFMDTIPVVIKVDKVAPSKMLDKIYEVMAMVSKHHVSFLNLVWNLPSALKWGEVMNAFQKTHGGNFKATCLLNYAGNAEEEYDQISEYTLGQLEGEGTEKLDYANYYGLVKVVGNQLDIILLCDFIKDKQKVQQVFSETTEYLLKLRMEEIEDYHKQVGR